MSRIVFLNGRFLPENEAVISVADRAFKYGDGVFETILASHGELVFWEEHWERFAHGAQTLSIPLRHRSEELRNCAKELIRLNQSTHCILRMQLSRGASERGYSIKNATGATVVITVHDSPQPPEATTPRWNLVSSSVPLAAASTLSGCKTCNRLPQILAKIEADQAGADDALLLSPAGEPLESSSANLFWILDGVVCTPPLDSGVLPGITRRKVLDICERQGIAHAEKLAPLQQLHHCDALLCTLTTLGLVEVVSLNGDPVRTSPLFSALSDAYRATTQLSAVRGTLP